MRFRRTRRQSRHVLIVGADERRLGADDFAKRSPRN